MILIERGKPSDELSALLEAQNSNDAWISIDPSNTTAMRDAFSKAFQIRKLTKEELFVAQRGLCAYCMAEISLSPTKDEEKDKKIKIEHYVPLSKDKKRVFDFDNYFLACTGGSHDDYRNSKEGLCCDSKKEERSLTINPTNPDHISHLWYQDDGMIMFSDPADERLTNAITNDLNITLGLNGTFYMKGNNNKYDTRTQLVEQRKLAFQWALDEISTMKDNHKYTKKNLELLIAKEEKNPQKFSGVYLFVYRRELNKYKRPLF